jgi:hypothetical protein
MHIRLTNSRPNSISEYVNGRCSVARKPSGSVLGSLAVTATCIEPATGSGRNMRISIAQIFQRAARDIRVTGGPCPVRADRVDFARPARPGSTHASSIHPSRWPKTTSKRKRTAPEHPLQRRKVTIDGYLCAGGGNRTRTPLARPRILSPVRLPVPPPRLRRVY